MPKSIYYVLAIKHENSSTWMHFQQLNRGLPRPPVDMRTNFISIPFGTGALSENYPEGRIIRASGEYYFPDEEAGLLYQETLERALYDFSGDPAGRFLDVCTLLHSGGIYTQIWRKCYIPKGEELKFTGGHTERWRHWEVGFNALDPNRRTTAANGSVPGASPYELWSGRGQTFTFVSNGTGGTARNSALNDTVDVVVQTQPGASFEVGKIYIWGHGPGEIVRVLQYTDGVLTLQRGIGGSIPYPHQPGDIFILPNDQSPLSGFAEMNLFCFWPDQVQTVIDDETASEMQKRVGIFGGSPATVGMSVQAGNLGLGPPGTFTKIKVGTKPWNETGPTTEIKIQQGQNYAELPFIVPLNAGDSVYAWISDDSAKHSKVQLTITGFG
jgi:hypothetical protein